MFQYTSLVTKYDSKGYSKRSRGLIITTEAIYIMNQKDFKLKLKILISTLVGQWDIVFVVNLVKVDLTEELRYSKQQGANVEDLGHYQLE
jgi:hypothetical protein